MGREAWRETSSGPQILKYLAAQEMQRSHSEGAEPRNIESQHKICDRGMTNDEILVLGESGSLCRHGSTRYHREFAAVWKGRGELRVPGDAGQLFLARFPLRAGKDARSDFDEARGELENSGGVPGAAVAGAIFADVERVGHAGEGNVLDDHFSNEA